MQAMALRRERRGQGQDSRASGAFPAQAKRRNEGDVQGRSLHGDRLGQVARLVHVAAPLDGGVVGQQLHGHDVDDR